MLRRLAVITARGGSKRIPKKNIKLFNGRPIISYSIKAAIDSKLFDLVMVSTDSLEIAKMAESYGAEVPFMRSEDNSNDFASTADVLIEVLDELKLRGFPKFDEVLCLYPTAPFVRDKTITKAYNLMIEKGYDTVFPIIPFSFPIQRSLRLVEDKVQMTYPEYKLARSQDLETMYHDAGQFYWLNVLTFQNNKTLYSGNTGGLVISELEGQDIDKITDWKLAEMKYKLMNEK